MIKIILTLVLSFAAYAGEDDEMKTEIKKDSTPMAADSKTPVAPHKAPAPLLDPMLRARIRAKAPFWIDDTSHGAAIRINKDGTFSSESQGGGATAGQWKALKGGEMEVLWSDGGEKYKYVIGGSGKEITIKGRPIKKNRVNLN